MTVRLGTAEASFGPRDRGGTRGRSNDDPSQRERRSTRSSESDDDAVGIRSFDRRANAQRAHAPGRERLLHRFGSKVKNDARHRIATEQWMRGGRAARNAIERNGLANGIVIRLEGTVVD